MNDTDKFDEEDKEFEKDKKDGFYQPDTNPESQNETIRKSGLVYGAVISLVGSILLFMGIGWAVDKYLQSSPWGIVIGIIFGAIVGFYQFIRLTSQE
jgi:F0F1-type ATP synthase assembly protein I